MRLNCPKFNKPVKITVPKETADFLSDMIDSVNTENEGKKSLEKGLQSIRIEANKILEAHKTLVSSFKIIENILGEYDLSQLEDERLKDTLIETQAFAAQISDLKMEFETAVKAVDGNVKSLEKHGYLVSDGAISVAKPPYTNNPFEL